MKNKDHHISNDNKNIVYVINNVPTRRRQITKKKQATNTSNYSLPPEQGFRAPDNRFLNSSNLNTEIQRNQLENLMNPKLRGKENEIKQRIFNIQNSIKEEDETLSKMNTLYSRFDSTPRFENSINNIYGLNENDNQGTFGATQGSDYFINEGIDRDQYITPSDISNISQDRLNISPKRLFTPTTVNESNNSFGYISSDSDTLPNLSDYSTSPIRTPQILSPSLIDAFKEMKLQDTPQQRNITKPNTPMNIASMPFKDTNIPSRSTKLEDTPQLPFSPMNIVETPFVSNTPMSVETNIPQNDTIRESPFVSNASQKETDKETTTLRPDFPKKPSNKVILNMLKDEYRALGGDNPVIFSTTRKKTVDGEIKRLKTVRDLREAYSLNGGTNPILLEGKMVNVSQLRKAITEQQKELKSQQKKASKHKQRKGT
jgi:hypothetical protein